MAGSSSSGVGKISKGPQVFINFRGEELRNGFLDYLEPALKDANINVFIDDHEQIGTKLVNLLVRIEQSKVALAIFSKEYTTSEWPLNELVKIQECMDKGDLIGIPIFYKIDPSVVKNLKGSFGDNFRELQRTNRHDLVKTKMWEEALTSITETKGIHLSETSGQSDRKFIKLIVKKVKSLLENIPIEGNGYQKGNEVNNQCSMIYAKKMEIEHSQNPEYWTWSSINDDPNEVATLNEVYWLEIKGSYYTRKLIPETKYEVMFVVKLEETADGWEEPVSLTMKVVNRDKSESVQERTVYLEDYVGDEEWFDVKAGDFVAPSKEAPARIYFTMCQCDDEIRKSGLVVKGVAIRGVN